MFTYALGMHKHLWRSIFSRAQTMIFLIVPCVVLGWSVSLIPAALQVPLAVTWLTVYHQLQMCGKPTFGLPVLVIVLSVFDAALHVLL